MQSKRLQNLQILRGLAAILVCCFHARPFLNGTIKFGEILFVKGNIGVPIFFIISGFIMVYTTRNISTNPFKNFMLKRIIRVVPLYYILTFVSLIFINGENYINDGLSRILKVLLFIPVGEFPPLYVGWTLNYEMFFYILFGMSLLFKKRRYFFLYSIILSLVFLIPLITNGSIALTPKDKNYENLLLNLITNSLLLQFLLGVFLGNIITKIKFHNNLIIFSVSLSILIFTLYYFSFFSFIQSDLVVCGFLVFSILLLDLSKINSYKPKILIYFGDISYSIYLVHPIIITLLPRLFKNIGIGEIIQSKLFFLIILIVTILSAIILYEFIEKQFSEFLKKKFIPQK